VCENISNATFEAHLCGTTSLTVRVSQTLGLLEIILGRKFEGVMGNWRTLHKRSTIKCAISNY
jgi:hypothetical protein